MVQVETRPVKEGGRWVINEVDEVGQGEIIAEGGCDVRQLVIRIYNGWQEVV
jgi:hypothetical protein